MTAEGPPSCTHACGAHHRVPTHIVAVNQELAGQAAQGDDRDQDQEGPGLLDPVLLERHLEDKQGGGLSQTRGMGCSVCLLDRPTEC